MNEQLERRFSTCGKNCLQCWGVALASDITLTAQTSCILEQTELFTSCPKCATIQHGYQHVEVEKAHATHVIYREHVIVSFPMLLALPKRNFHREAAAILTQWFEVLCQEQVRYDDNHAKKA